MKRIYVDPSAYLARAARAEFASPEWHDLALLAHRLRRDGPTGELVCLSALPPPVPPAAHQLSAAVAIVETMGGRALLADEEGLDPVGTAALVVREWVVRGRGRILVAAPRSRHAPWRDALGEWHGRAGADVVLTDHSAGLDLVGQGWDCLVVDGAHRLAGDDRAMLALAAAPPRVLLVTSTPVRAPGGDLYPVLALLGVRGEFEPRRHVVRRSPPPCINSRLSEIVRLEGSAAERALAKEARESAMLAIASGGEVATAWRRILQAAESLPAALPRPAAAVLDAAPEALARARVLSLLRTAQLAAVRTPSKIEALVPLIGASTGRALVAVGSAEAAAWVRGILAERGLAVAPAGTHVVVPGERVRVIADGEALKADPAAYSTLIHLDTPWDHRRLAARLARLAATADLRVFHLAIAGTVEDHLLACYQEALALATPPGDIGAVVAEAADDPEELIARSLLRSSFDDWAETLRTCRAAACGAYYATSQALDALDLSI